MKILKTCGTKIISFILCLAICCGAALLFACKDNASTNGNNEAVTNETRSAACKEVAATIGASITAQSGGTKGYAFKDSTDGTMNGVALTLIYYMGLLYENPDFNITDRPMRFGGKYDYTFGGGSPSVMTIYLNAYAVFDTENSYFAMYWMQEVEGQPNEDIYLVVSYDFAEKTVGDLLLFSEMGYFGFCNKISDGKCYILDTSEQDEEYQTLYARYSAMYSEFAELKKNTEDLSYDVRDKFVAAQLYADNLLNQNSGVSVHND